MRRTRSLRRAAAIDQTHCDGVRKVMNTSTWNIDTTHSGINFSVRHMVVSKVRGKFADWRGSVIINEDDLTLSSVEVVIQAASIETGVADRDQHLRSPDFLDAARYPEITFRS